MRTLAKKAKRSKQPVRSQSAVTTPFAFTTDGQVFINAAECKGRSLEGRSQFVGVLMTRQEARFARKAVDDAAFNAASRIAGRMPKKKRGASTSTKGKTVTTPKSRKGRRESSASSGSSEAS
jgi:hypothetical protein